MRPLRVAQPRYSGPLVVLVDSRSGSGGDVFPGAIQDAGRGPIVGTPTVGKVLSGDYFELPGGLMLLYPAAEMLRLDGSRFEANPVVPDVELTPRQTADDAFILRVARELLPGTARAAAGSGGSAIAGGQPAAPGSAPRRASSRRLSTRRNSA